MTSGNLSITGRNHFLMKHHFLFVCLFCSVFLSPLKAQDQANFTQFYLNPYLFNPSYAGIDGQSALSIIYRRQWINIDGGPSIANVSLHTPVNPKISVGMSITNDQKGLLNNSSLLFSLGYNVALEEHAFLRFGISAGGTWNTLDLEKLDDSDPAMADLLDKNASITGNAGASLHLRYFHFGISMPTLFSPSYVSKNAFTITEVKPFQTLIFNASNRFYFNNNKNVFEPYVVYRLNNGLPSQYEIAGIVHLNHMVWAGGSFKQDFGISAMGGVKLKNILSIGGAYSLKNSGINELNSPTFEISLNYLIGKRKKGTLAYSFVNTVKEKEKKPVVRLSAAEAKKKQEELERKKLEAKKREEEVKKKQAEMFAKAEAEKKAKAKVDSVAAQPQQHNPRFRQDLIENTNNPDELVHEQEQQALKKLDEHAEDPTEHHGEDPDLQPHAERHEFVKRGDHEEELDVADYVIGGVFKSDANAKHFAEGLNRLGFKADYGHLTEKTLWYVYLIQTDDINLARAERDRVRKMKILRDAWLLTVHH